MPDGGIVSDLGGRERFETVSFKVPIDLRDMSGTPYEMTAQTARSPKSKWRVIGIPGTPSRPYMWTRFVRKAPEDLDVSAVNRAGYGGAWYGTHRRPPVLSLDDQIAALAPLIEGDDRPAIVVGVSYGGALSLKAAMEFPRHIKGAVSVAALITEPRAYVRALLPAGDWPIIKQALPCHLHNAIAEVGGRRDQVGAVFSQLKKYQKPVTILHGNLDTLVPQSDAKVLRGYFAQDADVSYQPVNGGTHYLELLNVKTVYAAVRDVIKRVENADSAAEANSIKATT